METPGIFDEAAMTDDEPVNNQRPRSLKAWRVAQGLTQAEAGAMFDITQVQWSRLELGRRRPSTELAQRLVEVTRVSLRRILQITPVLLAPLLKFKTLLVAIATGCT